MSGEKNKTRAVFYNTTHNFCQGLQTQHAFKDMISTDELRTHLFGL